MSTTEVALYREKAMYGKEQRDFFEFARNIALAEDKARGNAQMLKEIYLEEVNGLFHFYEYQKGIEVVEEALKMVEDGDEIERELLFKKGKGLVYLGKWSEAREIFEHTYNVGSKKLQLWSLISLMWVLGYMFDKSRDKGLLEQARQYGLKALELCEDEDVAFKARASRNLGMIYWYMKDYEKALGMFFEANAIFEGQNPNVLNNVAATYVSVENVDLAQDFVNKAERLAEEQKNAFELAKSYFIRGKIEEELVNDYIHAKDYYLIAYDSFIDANAYQEAFKMMRRISDLDKKLDEESIAIFSRKMKMYYDDNEFSVI